MKLTTLKSVAIALGFALPAFGQTAVSPVVGYETVSLQPGQFNFFGLRFAEKVETTGQFESGDATSLTDNEGDFSFVEDGQTYIIEFAGGSSIVAESESFNGNSVAVDGTGFTGIDFTIRRVARLGDVFGENNEAGLLEGNGPDTADVIFLPQPDGSFAQVFRNPGLSVGTTVINPPFYSDLSGNVADPALVFTEAILVRTQAASSPSFTVAGALITSPQAFPLNGGDSFNFVSSIYPVGATLGDTNLADNLQEGTGVDNSDVVFLPRASGAFDQFFFNQGLTVGTTVINPPGWQNLAGDNADAEEITSGFIILRRGDDTTGTISPPPVITDL